MAITFKKIQSTSSNVIAAILLLCCFGYQCATPRAEAQAMPSCNLSLVTVSGDAMVNVVPDKVVVTLGVESKGTDADAVRKDTEKRAKAIVIALKNFAVTDREIQTDYLNINSYDDCAGGVNGCQKWQARQSIVVTLKTVSKVTDLIASAFAAGANVVLGVDFQVTELRKYRDQARRLAVLAAKEKATLLTSELNQTLGRVHSISEQNNWWSNRYNSWWWGRSGGAQSQNVFLNSNTNSGEGPHAADSSLPAGQIGISASVTVQFLLE